MKRIKPLTLPSIQEGIEGSGRKEAKKLPKEDDNS